ncbi:MAG: RluA family pseudouridine synthase [Myxococcales bacterium]|nr:RluA family pseudouridine synthase [Myxococcales bacterium]
MPERPPIEFVVAPSEAGERLDHLVATQACSSRSAARRVIDAGQVRVNGRLAKKGLAVRAGDRITVAEPPPDAEALRPLPEPLQPLVVLHADDLLIALDKPPGVPIHPLQPGERGTLAGALVARFPECRLVGDDPREAGFLHRLDIDTSGVVLAARTQEAWTMLRSAFREGRVTKEYLALCAGRVDGEAVIDAPLAHDPCDHRRVIGVADPALARRLDARAATTRLRALDGSDEMTLLAVTIATGRMHQIRAHLAHAGHALVGDALYGGPPALPDAPGHFLHAVRIVCPHPSGGEVAITAPLPVARAVALARLGLTYSSVARPVSIRR